MSADPTDKGMPIRLSSAERDAIDLAVWNLYKGRLGGTELAQLAVLFRSAALPRILSNVIRPTLTRNQPFYREEIETKLAWIDKHPVAEFPGIKGRGELGDAAVYYFENLRHRGQTRHQHARAVLLQAKVAKSAAQIRSPNVPIGTGISTARELALYSAWGTFDLYAGGGPKLPLIADNITVTAEGPPSPQGWFIATPRSAPGTASLGAWRSPWMCGPARASESCSATLGDLLVSFLAPHSAVASTMRADVGSDFNFDPIQLQTPTCSGWDRLCIEILRYCRKGSLPKSIFGANLPPGSAYGSTIRSFPYVGGGDDLPDFMDILSSLIGLRKMWILIVVKTNIEGPQENLG